MVSTEILYILAGGVAIFGAVRRDGHWPAKGIQSVLATAVLVLIAAATNGTKLGPLVRAFGIVLLVAAGSAAIRANRGVAPARATPNSQTPGAVTNAAGQVINVGAARPGKPAAN